MKTLIYNKSTRTFSEEQGPWYVTRGCPGLKDNEDPKLVTEKHLNEKIGFLRRVVEKTHDPRFEAQLESYEWADGPFKDKSLATDEWIGMCIRVGGKAAYDRLPKVHQQRAVELGKWR